MKIKMYANYNVSGLKYPVYGVTPEAIHNLVTVIIPDDWETSRNDDKRLIITLPDGTKCLDYEIQTLPNGTAYYCGVDTKRWYVDVRTEAAENAAPTTKL